MSPETFYWVAMVLWISFKVVQMIKCLAEFTSQDDMNPYGELIIIRSGGFTPNTGRVTAVNGDNLLGR